MKHDIIPYIENVDILTDEFKQLYQNRLFSIQKFKNDSKKNISLTSKQREIIFNKTGGLCHVCGTKLDLTAFDADHVIPHSLGGENITDNYLPSCSHCNGYRWNYSPEEIQWIFKLGVWLKTKIQDRKSIGLNVAHEFLQEEIIRESKRKNPRLPKVHTEINAQTLFPTKGLRNRGQVQASYEEVKKAREIIKRYQYYIEPNSDFVFQNKSFVISGESNLSRKDIVTMIENKGANIKKSVTKKLNYLVIGDFYGLTKIYKVENINNEGGNVKILSQNDLIRELSK